MTAQLAEPVGAFLPPIVAVVGATGTGKSGFALDLAEALGSHGHRVEIINADAMQLYEGLDIGTAKLAMDERRGFPTTFSMSGASGKKRVLRSIRLSLALQSDLCNQPG